MPMVVISGLFILTCAWSLTSLTCYHMMIVALAQTTNEQVRGVFQFDRNENSADEGCFKNCINSMCGPRPESMIPNDFSEMVICEPVEDEKWSGEISTMKNNAPKGVVPND